MTKPNRVLKAIDKNSLPKIIDIIEVPKTKESKSSTNEPSKFERSNGTVGSIPIASQTRRERHLASSKTPKISNLGGNRNVTTRRGRATNRRPPKPNSISSAQRSRKGISTPYGVQMARLQNRKKIETALTPSLSKSPNLLRHYDRLKPIACRLYNQHSKQSHDLQRSTSLLSNREGGNSLRQKDTINSTPSFKRTPRPTFGNLSATPSKGRSVRSERSPLENSNARENGRHNETKNQDSSDDMNCDSGDELSLNSSSSSSAPEKSPLVSTGKSNEKGSTASSSKEIDTTSDTGTKHQLKGESQYPESNPKSSLEVDDTGKVNSTTSSTSPMREVADKKGIDMTGGTSNAHTIATANAAIEDRKVFNLVMGSKDKKIDDELLGSAIGDSRFVRESIDEDSGLTSFSSVGDEKSTPESKEQIEPEELRATVNASHDPESPPLPDEPNIQEHFSPKIHDQTNDYKEEQSVEAWSINGHSSSPFFFEIGGKKYGHPALPPGWTMRISRSENRPVYIHPDHGRTWHCPIKLTPNMVYVKNGSGKFVKKGKSIMSKNAPDRCLESSKEDMFTPRSALCPTPQTPPSLRSAISVENERRQIVTDTKDLVEADHFPPQQEDEDSTFKLMSDISRLSAGLMKNSSSNLQKVKDVKTIHEEASNLTKEVISTEKELESKQENQRPMFQGNRKSQTQSTTSRLLQQNDQAKKSRKLGPPIRKLDLSEQSNSTSSQGQKLETPSTMSDVLRQYEQTLSRCHNTTTFSESDSDRTLRQGLANRNTPKVFAHEGSKKQLSPIRESIMRSNVVDRGRDRRFSSGTPTGNFKSNLFHEAAMSESGNKITNQRRGNSLPSTESANGNKNLAPNLLPSQMSEKTEHIEAWFTPAVQIEKVTRSTKDNSRNSSYEDEHVLRMGIKKKKDSRSRVYSNEKIPQDEELQAQTSIQVYSHSSLNKASSTPVKQPSIPYEDEWSPLAQSCSTRDKVHPKWQENYEHSSVGDNHRSTGDVQMSKSPSTMTPPLKDAKPVTFEKALDLSDDIPREIYFQGQHSSKNQKSKDGSLIDSHLQSTHAMENQHLANLENTNDTFLAVQASNNSPQQKQNDDMSNRSKDGTQKYMDTLQNTDPLENDATESSHTLSEVSDSELSNYVDNLLQTQDNNHNEATNITIAVHAHAAKKILSSTIKTQEQFDDRMSAATSYTGSLNSSDQRSDSYGAVTKEGTKSLQDMKQNSVTGLKFEADAFGKNESKSSQGSNDTSKVRSPKAGCGGDADNNFTMKATKDDTSAKANVKSSGKTLISEFASSQDLGATNRIEDRGKKSITYNTVNSDGGGTHGLDTDNEAGSCNGSFAFADDISETFQNSPVEAKLNIPRSDLRNAPSNDNSTPGSETTLSAGEFSTPSKKDYASEMEGSNEGSKTEAESSFESPVRPTSFENHDSSIESPFHPAAFDHNDDPYRSHKMKNSQGTKRSDFKSLSSASRKQKRMSWRVLNPPHPICSLQRLEELILQRKREDLEGKRPKRGAQPRRKKFSAKRRRKSKSRCR